MLITPIGRDETVALLSDLVAIDSINPDLVPGAAGEAAIALYVADWLSEAGLEVRLQEVTPGRPNVVATFPGTGKGPSLLLNAHVDTVGVTGMDQPFVPTVEGDRLYGRGAYDMKGGLGAIMLAARAVARAGHLPGDLILSAVVDEEYASQGTQAVVREVRAEAAIVTEPTNLRLCVAHKGFAWLKVETVGRAAHGSKPDLGIDAITRMGHVLVGLDALSTQLNDRAGHPLLGAPSVHASLIEGGQELSSYPDRCRLQVERRTLPGETPDDVLEEVVALLSSDHGTADLFFWREPFEIDPDAVIARIVSRCAAEALGASPEIYGDTPWMDAALLSAAGIPTVVFGPGGSGAHAVEEYVFISQVSQCADILARTALEFCSGSS